MPQQRQIVNLIELGVANPQTDFKNLQHSITALAQESARTRLSGDTPTALTDSSTGVAPSGNGLAAVVTPTKGEKDGAASFPTKASFDTEIGLVQDGHQELAAKLSEFIAVLGGQMAPTVETLAGAAAADDTIAAMGKSATTGTTNVVDAKTGIQQIVAARNTQASLAAAVNWCRVACGLAPITDNSGGTFTKDGAQGAWPTYDQAATAAAVTANGAETLTSASVDQALDTLADNVASLSAALNELTGSMELGPFVVATQNPHTRMVVSDTDPAA